MPLICSRFFLTTELDCTFRFTDSAYAASTCELRSQGQLGRILSHRIDRQGAKPRTRFVGHGFSRDIEHQKGQPNRLPFFLRTSIEFVSGSSAFVCSAAGTVPDNQQDVFARIQRAAHHEGGHAVIAVAEGIELRPEGIMVDSRGDGLACYWRDPRGSDARRRGIIIATFAGYLAELRFCKDDCYQALPFGEWFPLSCDCAEAIALLNEMSVENMFHASVPATWQELQEQAKRKVDSYWPAIREVANALMAKKLEPLKSLPSGNEWSKDTVARCLQGEEISATLRAHGITTVTVLAATPGA
jgi:hypothetical protein